MSGVGGVFRPAPPRVAISLMVDKGVYDSIAKRAGTMGIKPLDYFRRLVDAAWHARVCDERGQESGDAALDRAVKSVFLLADCEPEFIAESLHLSPAWVEKILAGWRKAAGGIANSASTGRASAASASAPAGSASEEIPAASPVAVEGGARVKPKKGSRMSAGEVATIASMWRDGKPVKEIAEATGRPHASLEMWMFRNRDICPKRRGK